MALGGDGCEMLMSRRCHMARQLHQKARQELIPDPKNALHQRVLAVGESVSKALLKTKTIIIGGISD